MKYKYLLVAFVLSLCANANAEWFLRGTHNAWAAAQMESGGSNTMQLKGVVFTAAGNFKFDRFGDWKENYGVGGRSGSNIPVAAGTWDIKFFTNSKTWSITAAQTSVSYHVRGTHNDWLEGNLMTRIGTSDIYELCANFVTGDANGGPRFKIDPNGGWGDDGIPDTDVLVNPGWVKISFNSLSNVIATQQNLGFYCTSAVASSSLAASSIASSSIVASSITASSIATSSSVAASSKSSVASSSSLVSSSVKSSVASSSVVFSSAPASIYHVRGTFNGWLEGTLMTRVGTTSSYEHCANFSAGDGGGSPRFKIDPNGAWGDGIPAADFVVNSGWVKITFNSSTKVVAVQQNLPVNCAASTSSSVQSSVASSSVQSSVASSVVKSSVAASSLQSSVTSSVVASSVPASIYHLRGSFNSWQEGTLMSRVGTTSNYERCVNFLSGDANGGPRFKVDPNGGWGSDAVPAADFVVAAGWVKVVFNSSTKAISAQQNLAANCGVLASSSSQISSSSTAISSSAAVISSSATAISSSAAAISSSASAQSVQPLSRVSGMALDSPSNRALVLDEHGMIAINLTTGIAAKVFDAVSVGSWSESFGVAVDLPGNRALVTGIQLGILYSVDLGSGRPTPLASNRDEFAHGRSLAIDRANNRALVTSMYDYLVAVDLSSGEVSRFSVGRLPQLSDTVRGVVIDSPNNRALVLDFASVVAVNLTTGERSVLASDEFPNPDTSVDTLLEGGGSNSILLDSARNRVVVINQYTGRLIAVDLTTGVRSLILRGVPSASAIVLDTANNRILVTSVLPGGEGEGVSSIDLTTLEKKLFYK